MKHGFIKCAAATVNTVVADTAANLKSITELIQKADEQKVNLLVLPELCITGYTCGELFLSDTLINSAAAALGSIAEFTADKYPVVVVGLPVKYQNRLYNCAAVVYGGEVLGIVPKVNIPNSAENYEGRYFASAKELRGEYNCIDFGFDCVPISEKLVFASGNLQEFRFGVEIGEDLLSADSPARLLCASGAAVIANCSAVAAAIGKQEKYRSLITASSIKNICGYVYSNASFCESTQDAVYDAQLIIAENGTMLCENKPFGDKSLIVSEIDVNAISLCRIKDVGLSTVRGDGYSDVLFNQPITDTVITRTFEKNPFVPSDSCTADRYADEALTMQAYSLKKRFEHSRAESMVIGISGGLDSCLALLAAVNAADLMGLSRKKIIAVTLPAFGTTARTRSNAELMCENLGVTFREINIAAAVTQHFKDIGQDINKHDTTYENAQARERTQVLMDIANMENGLVIGTGDLSELALGWATYNGDHMSMYGVNAAIPKTAVRQLVKYTAKNADEKLRGILLDIIDTPVSPELLPPDKDGKINQVTEDLVGPYELHDFFIYYTLRYGFSPAKIFRMACIVFKNDYTPETVLKWLKTFFRRFFTQQFKRSCLPDGISVYGISLSPRSNWRMPSDASAKIWLDELENL